MRVVPAVLCLSLGACSFLGGTEFEAPPKTAAPDEGALRTAVTDGFRLTKLPGNPQVSALRETKAPQPGDWTVCFKSDVPDQDTWYAVFFRGNAPIATRRAVIIDSCGGQDYRPLDPPLPHKPSG
jgi:hypothetical protein